MKLFEQIFREAEDWHWRNKFITELEKHFPDAEIGEIVDHVDKMMFKGEKELERGFNRLAHCTGANHDDIVTIYLNSRG